MRMRYSGRSGSGPSHAARTSANLRGVHCGVTGVNAERVRPAASKSGSHAPAPAARLGIDLRWDGMKFLKPALRVEHDEGHAGHGQRRIACRDAGVNPSRHEQPRLVRYQNSSAAGLPVFKASQRRGF
jgi:hypothetical protein